MSPQEFEMWLNTAIERESEWELKSTYGGFDLVHKRTKLRAFCPRNTEPSETTEIRTDFGLVLTKRTTSQLRDLVDRCVQARQAAHATQRRNEVEKFLESFSG